MTTSNTNYNGPTSTTPDPKNKASEQVGKMTDAIAGNLHDVSRKVEHMAEDLVQRGKEVGDKVQAVAGDAKHAVDSSLRDQPLTTLAVAAALGFVLGAIWKS